LRVASHTWMPRRHRQKGALSIEKPGLAEPAFSDEEIRP
jgi:hypothetical protein